MADGKRRAKAGPASARNEEKERKARLLGLPLLAGAEEQERGDSDYSCADTHVNTDKHSGHAVRPEGIPLHRVVPAAHNGKHDVLGRLAQSLDHGGGIQIFYLGTDVGAEAQHHIVAVEHAVHGYLVAVGAKPIGKHHALEAPLAPEHTVEQLAVGARPLGTDEGEGGHDSQGIVVIVVVLHADFKRLHVDFPQGLLRQMNLLGGAAVDLLVVDHCQRQ